MDVLFNQDELSFFFNLSSFTLVSSLLKPVFFKLNLEVITQDSDQLLLISKPVQSFFSAP